MLAIVRDITDRKLAEKTLSEGQRPSADVVDLRHSESQQLTAALDNLQTASRLYNSDPETARKMLDEGVRLLHKAISESPDEAVAGG
jgi:uncharacterized membrane protein YccC